MHRGILLAAALLLVALTTPVLGFSASEDLSAGRTMVARAMAASPVVPQAADLSLSIASNVSVADPGDQVLLYASAQNTGNETATNVTLVARIDPNATYVLSFPNGTYDPINKTLRWTAANLTVGATINVVWTIRVNAGTPDNATIVGRFRASYANATGTPLPPKEVLTTVRVRAPVFNPQLRPLPLSAARGDAVVAKLYANNTGSGTALRAWSNWTLNGNFRFEYLEEAVAVTNVTDGFRIILSNLAPGPHALTAHLTVIRGMVDGLSMGIATQWTATDRNGNRLAPSTPGAAVDLVAPSLILGMNTSALQVNMGSRSVLTVTVRNVGHAPGIGWLNTTMPGSATFISDNASFARSNRGKQYTWTLPALSSGKAFVFGITFEASGTRAASFVFTLEFTDGKGSPTTSVSGPRLDVEIVGSPNGPTSPTNDILTWVALAGAAAGLVVFLVLWRRHRASDLQIEDVFVADMGGHLLAHRSSGLVAYEDEDILVGMFKVIQDFVKDSFAKGTDDMMKSMEFGERKIIIERGQFHFISVVYRGRDQGSLAERVRKVSRTIDHRFGRALENWSGDLDELRGLASLLPLVWKRKPRSRESLLPRPSVSPTATGPTAGTVGEKESGPAEPGEAGVAVETQE